MREFLDFMVDVLKKINMSFSSNPKEGQKLSLDVSDENNGIHAGISVQKEKDSEPNISVTVGQKK